MIQVNDLLDIFEQMLREHWSYELGAARKGCVDCSGAFVYAYRQLGAKIEHGSNTIARKRVGDSVPVSEAKPGYAVFKVKPWTEDQASNSWYGKAPGNVYHIGLMGRDGKVLNAQSTVTGFVSSPTKSWTFAAPLLNVSYNSAEPLDPNYGNAVVKTKSGSLNVRSSASSSGSVIGKLSSGTRVNIIREEATPWVYAETERGVNGYMSSTYLERDEDISASPETPISKAVVVRCKGYLNLRSTSDTDSKIVAKIPLGTTINIYEKSSLMWRTSYNGISGYVNSNYLDEEVYSSSVLTTGLLLPMSPEDAEKLLTLFKNARVLRD